MRLDLGGSTGDMTEVASAKRACRGDLREEDDDDFEPVGGLESVPFFVSSAMAGRAGKPARWDKRRGQQRILGHWP